VIFNWEGVPLCWQPLRWRGLFWLLPNPNIVGEARDRCQDALALFNSFGLLAEDVDPQAGALWGNSPQTYCMARAILSAVRLSQSWEDFYWHASS
jgi:hypothetical protein